MKRSFKILIAVYVAAVIALAVIVVVRESRTERAAVPELWFFDVGQGDAALIKEDGRTILIDGGPDDAVLEGLATALPPWRHRLDAIIVTHLDADHYAGLFAVLQRYEVGEIRWSGVAPTTETARRFVETVERRGIPQTFVAAGFREGFTGGRSLQAVWPAEGTRGLVVTKTSSNKNGGGTNDLSVVTRYDCGEDEVLMTGDISSVVEERLVASGFELASEVLKVGHHGSAHSTSEAFLDAVRPREAILSSGAGNRYGHPAPRVIAALAERGIEIERTDRQGNIRYACEGGRLVQKNARRWWKL